MNAQPRIMRVVTTVYLSDGTRQKSVVAGGISRFSWNREVEDFKSHWELPVMFRSGLAAATTDITYEISGYGLTHQRTLHPSKSTKATPHGNGNTHTNQ